MHIVFTTLPKYTLHVGGTELDAGFHVILFALTSTLLRFYFGPLADRSGRRLPLLVGSFLFGISPVIWLIADNVYGLALGRIVHGAGMAAFIMTSSTLMADLVPASMRGLALGTHRVTVTLGLMIGPPLAAGIVRSYGFTPLYLLSAAAGLIAFSILFFIHEPKRHMKMTQSLPLHGFVRLLGVRPLRQALGGIIAISLGYGAVLGFLPLYAAQMEITNYGYWFTLFAVGGLLSGPVGGSLSDRYGRLQVIIPTTVLYGLGLSSLYLLPSPLIFLLSGLATGIGFASSITVLIVWIVDESTSELRATGLSLQENAIDLSFGIASLIFGASAIAIGYHNLFFGVGFIALVYALYLQGTQRRIPRGQTVDS